MWSNVVKSQESSESSEVVWSRLESFGVVSKSMLNEMEFWFRIINTIEKIFFATPNQLEKKFKKGMIHRTKLELNFLGMN